MAMLVFFFWERFFIVTFYTIVHNSHNTLLAAQLFLQKLIQANSKENIKALYLWPVAMRIQGIHMIPLTKG